jgi:hypothetical protein
MLRASLTLGLTLLLAAPAAAQFRFTPTDQTGLLSLESVQDELKLTDEQKKALAEANEHLKKSADAALAKKDLAGLLKARQEHGQAVRKVLDRLDGKQLERLAQIEYQACSRMKDPRTFANEHVQKGLKLSDGQKKKVQETIDELDRQAKTLDDDTKDLPAWFGNLLKKGRQNAQAYAKIVEALDDGQKKSLEKLGGAKVDLSQKKKDK